MRHTLDSKSKLILQRRAQLMRAHPSEPERVLWLAIRRRRANDACRDLKLARHGYRVLHAPAH